MKIALVSLLLISLVRCSEQPLVTTENTADTVIIRSGTLFGMCIGYCNKDMELVATTATFTKKSRDSAKYPTRTCTKAIAAPKSAELNALARFTEFMKLPQTIGCPDCADGGAEYLELQLGQQQHRVTFENGKTIPGFEMLVKELRTQRDLFSDCQ
ncbi:MAG: hypothetical protein LH609_09120 [Rudanella sp.]|nr:hypothetical protein [Rudanella sp.]